MVQLDRGDELSLKLDRWRSATRCLAVWRSWSAAKSFDEVELVRGVVVRDEELGHGVELVRGDLGRGGELGRGVGARA